MRGTSAANAALVINERMIPRAALLISASCTFRILSDALPDSLARRSDVASMNKLHGWLLIQTLMLACAANAADETLSIPTDLAPIISDAAQRYDIDEHLLAA